MTSGHIHLVESIPQGLDDLRGSRGVLATADVLLRLTNEAQHSIDLTAMYWSLLHDPTSEDESGFSDAQMAGFGAGAGKALHDALRDAAARGVTLRILESPGFGSGPAESEALRKLLPERIRSGPAASTPATAGSTTPSTWSRIAAPTSARPT